MKCKCGASFGTEDMMKKHLKLMTEVDGPGKHARPPEEKEKKGGPPSASSGNL